MLTVKQMLRVMKLKQALGRDPIAIDCDQRAQIRLIPRVTRDKSKRRKVRRASTGRDTK